MMLGIRCISGTFELKKTHQVALIVEPDPDPIQIFNVSDLKLYEMQNEFFITVAATPPSKI